MNARTLLLTTTLVAAGGTLLLYAQAAATTWAITGARIVTLAGPPIDRGTVVLREGRIVSVGTEPAPADAQVIDGTGLEVYPGFFDAMSQIGLTEIGQVTPTVDTTDVGDYNPHLVAITAIHPASEHIPVARADGITHALSAPGSFGGFGAAASVIPGQASVIHLDGWTAEDMAIRPAAALVLVWPVTNTTTFDFATFTTRQRPFAEVKRETDEKVASLTRLFDDARHYARAAGVGRIARDLRLEALGPVLDGRLPVIVVANRARDIRRALEFADTQRVSIILAGGADAWMLKDELAAERIPVILGPPLALPSTEDEPYDKPLTRAGELHAAGVKVAIATFNSSDSRTLPFEVGNTVAHGLPREEALKAITRYPAEMLGLGDLLGTIEPGKMANLVVASGDPLEMRSRIVHVFVNGRPVSLDNRHQQLYERYRARPRPAK